MQTLYRDRWTSPLGDLEVVVNGGGEVVEIGFRGAAERGRRPIVRSRARCAPVVRQLREYFAGSRRSFELELAPEGTPFQRRVWETVLGIPYGATRTYGEVARLLGDERATRAVGLANGANPVAIVIPCHRVVGSDGSLVGYGGGLERKAALLELEGAAGWRQRRLAFNDRGDG